MDDRAASVDGFLAHSDWAGWARAALAGDASGRRYMRLSLASESVILMDAPPDNGEDTRPFATIAAWLAAQGLCPPRILAHDAEHGIMILSDLGRDDFARWLTTTPQDAATMYRAAIDVLVHVQARDIDLPLVRMTPQVAAGMIDVAGTFYAKADVTDLMRAVERAFETYAPIPDTLALRDYHAENLIWRPEKAGLARVGLLDFQDAFMAPAGYDLASLLRDVRRDIDPALAKTMMQYFIEKTGADDGFAAKFACLGAQRNLRILGVFARLSQIADKGRYVDLIPRVWDNLMRDLGHPALAVLREATLDTLPRPDTATLARLRA
ncbi:phosphotransferase [Yoonia sp.]|uniref:aminoglycoside phosphotransferase family protein n=1 Tax=Yoonia sp. TaxID=2212373 RepID=UPI0025E74583|nr:phosphotransferase [Yoonia sp.]